MRAARALFGLSTGALAYGQLGYPLLLRALPTRPLAPAPGAPLPGVTLVVAAYAEASVIADKVADARAQDYPPELLRIVVACDGSTDGTPERARAAGADVVLELPRGGKMAAQAAAVAQATTDLVAFSDANTRWAPGALKALVAPFADPAVGYACGRVTFTAQGGTNQEGLYWRYEMALRALESARGSITAGNGGIYAVRRTLFDAIAPTRGHDLALPAAVVRRGLRAVDVAEARATEPMVPSLEGEWARKRRMMQFAWPIVREGLLDPRGLPPRYALFLFSHRALRYGGPLLHVLALATSARLARHGTFPALALAVQLAVLVAAAAGPRAGRGGLVARYYVLTTASIAAGLADHLRHGTPAGWEPAEGTR